MNRTQDILFMIGCSKLLGKINAIDLNLEKDP